MPKKYRIVRTDPGVLDLSQVLDDRGKPILLSGVGAATVVDEHTLKHPLVARYVGAGLAAEEVSLTPVQAPATPVVPAATAPPPAPPPKPTPPPAPPPEEPKPAVDDSPVMTSVDTPSTDEPSDADSKDEESTTSTTKKKAKTSGRSGKRSRGK
jgi:hypothetical protein